MVYFSCITTKDFIVLREKIEKPNNTSNSNAEDSQKSDGKQEGNNDDEED